MNRGDMFPPPFHGSFPREGQEVFPTLPLRHQEINLKPSTTILHPFSKRLGFEDAIKHLTPTINTMKP
jgi:hypothetical protein